MSITTGTPGTQTEHSRGGSIAGVLGAVVVPALLGFWGLMVSSWTAISWEGAVVWGFVATLVMTVAMGMARSRGTTQLDMADLLGSISNEPGSPEACRAGMTVHFINGMLLAVGWAYTMALLGWPTTWWTGLVWGAFIAVLAAVVLTSIGGVHPDIMKGRLDDPGTAGRNLGSMTPVGLVVAHLIYGFVLGLLYQIWPLA